MSNFNTPASDVPGSIRESMNSSDIFDASLAADLTTQHKQQHTVTHAHMYPVCTIQLTAVAGTGLQQFVSQL